MFQSQKYLLKTFFVNPKPLPTEYTEFNFFPVFRSRWSFLTFLQLSRENGESSLGHEFYCCMKNIFFFLFQQLLKYSIYIRALNFD